MCRYLCRARVREIVGVCLNVASTIVARTLLRNVILFDKLVFFFFAIFARITEDNGIELSRKGARCELERPSDARSFTFL